LYIIITVVKKRVESERGALIEIISPIGPWHTRYRVYKRQGVTLFFERIQTDTDRSIFRQSRLKQLRLFAQ